MQVTHSKLDFIDELYNIISLKVNRHLTNIKNDSTKLFFNDLHEAGFEDLTNITKQNIQEIINARYSSYEPILQKFKEYIDSNKVKSNLERVISKLDLLYGKLEDKEKIKILLFPYGSENKNVGPAIAYPNSKVIIFFINKNVFANNLEDQYFIRLVHEIGHLYQNTKFYENLNKYIPEEGNYSFGFRFCCENFSFRGTLFEIINGGIAGDNYSYFNQEFKISNYKSMNLEKLDFTIFKRWFNGDYDKYNSNPVLVMYNLFAYKFHKVTLGYLSGDIQIDDNYFYKLKELLTSPNTFK